MSGSPRIRSGLEAPTPTCRALRIAASLAFVAWTSPVPVAAASGRSDSIPESLPEGPPSAKSAFVSADLLSRSLDDLETLVGEETASDLRRRLEARADGDCVRSGPVILSGVNPDYGADFAGVVQRARLIVLGTVEATRPGFLHGIPGTMLLVHSERVVKAPRDEPRTSSFVFLPVGEFSVGDVPFCKTDSRFPPVPEIGRRVVVVSHSATTAALVPHGEIADEELLVVSDDGGVELPWRMADLGTHPPLEELLRRLEDAAASSNRPAP